MKIAVASGKGGTGKTTIATNLALCVGNVKLLDCDVEEPDSHLFLDIDLKEVEKVSLSVPVINKDRCTICGKCARFCQYHALAALPKEVLFFPELCHGCGGCKLVCPEDAITEERRVIGIIEGGRGDGIEFYRGLLKIGEPLATPIIRALKKRAECEKDVILDAPPGNACPVIETVSGTDYCILVTEPTPFGLHDLKLAVDVVRKLDVPFGVVINRDGVGNDGVERYCKEEGIPVLMRIAQDMEIARLYSIGIPFATEMPEWKKEFIALFEKLKSEAGR